MKHARGGRRVISVLSASFVLASACTSAGDDAPRLAATLKSPAAGTSVTLASGTTLTVVQAPAGTTLQISEEPTTRVGFEARQIVLGLSGTDDSAQVSIELALNDDSPSEGLVAVVTDPALPGVSLFVDPTYGQTTSASDAALGLPTAPRAASAAGLRRFVVRGVIRPAVGYTVNVVRRVERALSANDCPNVYLWDEVAPGAGTAAPLVMLIHGWQMFRHCRAPANTNVLGVSRMADYDAVGEWSAMSARLRADYPTARIVVPRYATEFAPALSAQVLLERMQADTRITASTRVVLAGHSMGGLVARHLSKRWRELTRSPVLAEVVTLGTPHEGTPIADVRFAGLVLNTTAFLGTEGSASLAPDVATFSAPLPLDVPLHTIAGEVGCSLAEDQRIDSWMRLTLRSLCRGSGRDYLARSGQGSVGDFPGVSDAVVPITSARAAATNATSRTTLTGSTSHTELRTAAAALGKVSGLVKPYLAAVASVSIGGLSGIVPAGSNIQLTGSTFAADGTPLTGRAILWTSSNNAVATVSTTGLLRSIATGTATITATSEGRAASLGVVVGAALGSGDVQVTLTWDGGSDIDLWVTEPNGGTIWWGVPTSTTGGLLDYDDRDGYGPENIYWPTGRAPQGTYRVRVHYYEGSGAMRYSVVVRQFGYSRTYTGTLSVRDAVAEIVTFTTGVPLAMIGATDRYFVGALPLLPVKQPPSPP